MRNEFYKVIQELVRNDPLVYLLSPDFSFPQGFSLEHLGKNHLINTGLTEAATMGMASGMALSGLKPYVIGINPFVLERTFEQIKLDVVQQGANVKVLGYWDYPTAGPTHRTNDVQGLCKALGITLREPKDSEHTRNMMVEEYGLIRPCFFYLTKDRSKK